MKVLIIVGVIAAIAMVILRVIKGIIIKMMLRNEDPKFWARTIKKMETRDKGISDVDLVFVGSSSIRRWKSLEEDFSEYKVVNHGFGGSKLGDTVYYFDRLVTAYKPKAIVVFSGSNDIHGTDETSKSGEEVFERFKALLSKSQKQLKNTPLYYISISPTKARWGVWDEIKKANKLISEYVKDIEHCTYIEITNELFKDGKPNQEMFTRDALHMNEKGYALWTSILKPIVTQHIN